MPEVVLIAKSDQVARAGCSGMHEVDPVAQPFGVLEDVDGEGGCGCKIPQQRNRRVRGTVVGYDQLADGPALPGKALELPREVLLAVECRQRDREGRGCHQMQSTFQTFIQEIRIIRSICVQLWPKRLGIG